ncbi:phage holin [Brochothrix thermosphacta]|uniref:phage holin n=1 Tax=Brochothrix thermosphacta TaxID=2756 RepID=UPI00083FC731|nr:phage holin [Brochothrix thermosphacta]ODJ71973.1 phage holin [Brochothrix thermosphacta]
MKVNWHSKILWTSLTALFVVFIQQIAAVFGLSFDSEKAQQLTGIINTVLTILATLGIVYDTTTDEKGDK